MYASESDIAFERCRYFCVLKIVASLRERITAMERLLSFLRRNRGDWTAEQLRNHLKLPQRDMARMLSTLSKYQAVHVRKRGQGAPMSYRARPSMRAACDRARGEMP